MLKHLAIIPDGNRRWAKERGFFKTVGHAKSSNYKNMIKLCREAEQNGVQYLSIWGFSTENWKRDKKEVSQIFSIILNRIDDLNKRKKENQYIIKHIGRKDRLPKKLINQLIKLEKKTKNYTGLTLLIGLDYGGRDELLRATRKIIDNPPKILTETTFRNYLDTKNIPDPELIIRTGGEKRLSGFLPFQSTYSELHFTDTYFPALTIKELKKILIDFKKRKRRFGK